MRKILFTTLIALIALTSTEAVAKRKHVRIYKPSPPVVSQPIYNVPLVAIPPVAMVVDIALRTSCDPKVISYGRGPGWSSKDAIVGNFLLPAVYTRCGYPTPKWLLPALPKKA